MTSSLRLSLAQPAGRWAPFEAAVGLRALYRGGDSAAAAESPSTR